MDRRACGQWPFGNGATALGSMPLPSIQGMMTDNRNRYNKVRPAAADAKGKKPMWKFTSACLIAMLSTAAQADVCTLTDSDVASLAASPSQLTAQEFSALPPDKQTPVCETRAFLHQVDAQNGVIDNILGYNRKYLTPAESDRIVSASNGLLNRLLQRRREQTDQGSGPK